MMDPDEAAQRPGPRAAQRRDEGAFGDEGGWDSGAAASPVRAGSAGFSGKLDSSDQWNTRWLWTGFGVLAALLVALGVLWLGVMRTDADKLFESAELNFRNGAYGKAGEEFQKFHTKFPRNERAALAKVREVNAFLRMRYEAKDYKNAYDYAIQALPTLAANESINELRDDLGIMIPAIVRHFTRAHEREQSIEGVKSRLDEARAAKKALLDNPEWITTTMRNSQRMAPIIADIENDLLAAEGKIQREKDLQAASQQIQQLTVDGRTDDAFAAFTRLVRVYPDLGARQELRELMAQVSARERELVQPAPARIESGPGAPPSSVTASFLSAVVNGTPLGRMNGEVIAVLAEGAVYGLDAGTGQVLWREFVGLGTNIQPVWTSETSREALIVSDQQRQLVMRIAADSGTVVWTARIGEPFFTPRVSGDSVYVAAASGLVVRLDLADGNQLAGARLPRKIAAGCEVADQQPWLFLAGDDSNLYQLSSEDLTCQAVYYLGHPRGAISLAPLWWSGYLLQVVNGSDYAELYVLQRAEESGAWRRVQLIRLANGRISMPPVRMGRMALYTSDVGDVRIVDMNPLEPEAPVQIATEGSIAVRGGVRTWSQASGSDVWIAGMGITPLRLQRATGNLERVTVLNQADIFLGPIQKRDDLLFHLRRRGGSRLVSVAAVDSSTMEEKWRTDFGGAPPGPPWPGAGGLMQVTAQGNLVSFNAGQAGPSLPAVLALASDIDEPLLFTSLARLDNGDLAATGASGSPWVLRVETGSGRVGLQRLVPPADQPACLPLAVGNDLVIASSKGQVMRIDLATGQMSGSPYQPPLSPGQSVRWNRPARTGETTFLIGNGESLISLMDLSDGRSVRNVAERSVDGQIVSGLAGSGNDAWFVEQRGNSFFLVKATVSGSGFELAAGIPVGGLPTQDPLMADGLVLVATEDGQLSAWSHGGERRWQIPTDGTRIAGIVSGENGATVVSFENGQVRVVGPGGEAVRQFDVGQPVVHQPLVNGGQWLFTAADGTLLLVKQP